MRRSVSFVAVALLIFATNAVAGEVTVGPFSVSLPTTFVGPERAAPDANTRWSRTHRLANRVSLPMSSNSLTMP
jgi:hypothetical protein